MIILKGTTETLEFVTTSTAQLDFTISWADLTTTSFSPSTTEGSITTATTTTALAAPAASTQRQVKLILIRNRSTTVSNTVRVQKDIAATDYWISPTVNLRPGESLQYSTTGDWITYSVTGQPVLAQPASPGYAGTTHQVTKTTTTAEGAFIYQSMAKDAGSPGAWSPGTPGLNGRNCDGTTAADAGCVPITNAPTGNNYLTGLTAASTILAGYEFWDVLWVNSGIAVTTTTNQAITQAALPARDAGGTADGRGVNVALLVTAATTNAGAVTNCTLSYTASDGTAGRTATMASFPATANVGTIVVFSLQAGDAGVRSITGITLGTSLVTGSVSLICFTKAMAIGCSTTNQTFHRTDNFPGTLLYSGVTLLPILLPTTTTAPSLAATLSIQTR